MNYAFYVTYQILINLNLNIACDHCISYYLFILIVQLSQMGAIWSRPADLPALTAPVIIYTNLLLIHTIIIILLLLGFS